MDDGEQPPPRAEWCSAGSSKSTDLCKVMCLRFTRQSRFSFTLFLCVKIYMCCWFLWKCLDLACYCQYSLLIEYVISRWHTGSGMGVLVENRYKMMTLQEDELGADLGWGHKLELFLLSQSCLTSCLCSAVLKDGETTLENTIWGIFKMSQLRTLVNHWLWWNSSFLSEKNHCCNFNFSLAVL